MDPVTDSTMRVIEYALEGVARRQDIHAHNIANSATPGYRAKKVVFEEHLQHALDTDRLDRTVNASVVDAGGVPNYQDNTVSLDTEMTALLKNNLVQDAMVQSFNFKMQILRSAIGR